MARSPNPTIISTPPFACTSNIRSTTHVQEGIPTKNRLAVAREVHGTRKFDGLSVTAMR